MWTTGPLREDAAPASAEERFFFDLNGYVVVSGALASDEVEACNCVLDGLQQLRKDQWAGWVHGHDYGGKEGLNLQQIYEAGESFERLIDHPSWIEKVRLFVGGEGTFDYHHGALFIDECFANIREAGEAIGLHSGGHERVKRCQFDVRNGKFACGQVNVLVALTDIGPGDGATIVVPASHKANFPHPAMASYRMTYGEMRSADGVAGAVEVPMRAGDALIFVDAIMHGSAARINPGQRRISVSRYGPSWGITRHGYRPSPDLLARLTPTRRSIVQPAEPLLPPNFRYELVRVADSRADAPAGQPESSETLDSLR
jgi:hypothetical protein